MSATEPPVPRPTPVWRVGVLVLCGIVAIGAATWFGLSRRSLPPAQTADVPLRPAAAPPAAAERPAPARVAQPAASAAKPSFDIVRIDRGGNAVIAGHAAPGATVTVHDGTHAIGRATADAAGAWALVPAAPLPAGGQTLTLSARDSHGTVVAGAGSVVLAVPPHAPEYPAPPALAMLTTPHAAPRLLQGPAVTGTTPSSGLGVDAVDEGTHGVLRLSGHAPPGATLRVYVDNRPAGDARAGPDGRWSLIAPVPAAARHVLRIDRIDGQGKVLARVEVPFDRAAIGTAGLRPGQVIVEPGQSLWRIARREYGRGVLYGEIYAANLARIRNPDLIYPGQIFTLPNAAVGATPASPSTSR